MTKEEKPVKYIVLTTTLDGWMVDKFPNKTEVERFLNRTQPNLEKMEIYEVAHKIAYQTVVDEQKGKP